ncbi:MAG: Xaa-Pro peptidase family protein, partial [Victivallales bacterium]|nr:Xaa-Pro peptidase family protein [Victivallales bacterium]
LGVELKIAKGDFFPERKIKTKSEIDKIREAVRTAEKCMSRTETVLREAKVDNDNYLVWNDKVLTSEALHAEICFEAINNNSTAVNTIAASGVDSSQPHNIGSGPIKAGTPIVVDIFPRMNKTGYWGDMTRTFVKGKAPDKIKKAYETVLKAKEKAKEKIRNGVKASEIHKLAVDILDKQGFTTGTKDGVFYGFFHSLGHGLGLDIHENPIVSTKTDAILKTGNVITVEPGVYYREWGGIRLEDVIIVKDNGIECLTEYNEILELG